MTLALATGRVSPRALLAEMSPRELGLWAALWHIDPWGELRADLRNAITSYVVAESGRNTKAKSTPFRPRDFMPYVKANEAASSAELSKRMREVFKHVKPTKGR